MFPSLFLLKLDGMKIKKEYIGSRVKSSILNKWYTIEEGQEELYASVGLMNIFEEEEPKIIKKKDVKNPKRSSKQSDSDSDRVNDSDSPGLLSL